MNIPNPKPRRMPIAIFDLDGTLADDTRRRTLLPAVHGPDADYDAYHAGCAYDPAFEKTQQAVLDHRDMGHRIVFITARPISYGKETLAWLDTYIGPLRDFCLLMRPNDDHTPSPELKVRLFELNFRWEDVVAAYDDRADVLTAYERKGVAFERLHQIQLAEEIEDEEPHGVPEILREMAETFEERNRVYRSNYKMVGAMMRILFPDGVSPELLHSDHFHLFELKLVKLSRFAASGLTHVDSIHDDAVYSAMIESILTTNGV